MSSNKQNQRSADGHVREFQGPIPADKAVRAPPLQIVWLRNPPSTRMSAPVTKLLAFWLARKIAAPTSSCDSPKRFIGVCAQMDLVRSLGEPSSLNSNMRFCSAGKNPGVRVFTRAPFVAHSRARNKLRLSTAALAAE